MQTVGSKAKHEIEIRKFIINVLQFVNNITVNKIKTINVFVELPIINRVEILTIVVCVND